MGGLNRIIGQEQAVNRLRGFANHFRQRAEVPDHILLIGAEGTGKRTIGESFANELDAKIVTTNAFLLEKRGDLTAILTSLDTGDVLFLEDVQRLRQPLKEVLFPALRDFRIDLIIGQGPGHRVHPYKLNHFTCVASVPREGDLPPELRDGFPLTLRLQPYSSPELSAIAARVAEGISSSLAPAAAGLIASASNGNPHQAEVFVHRIARGNKKYIAEADVQNYFSILGMDFRSTVASGTLALDNLSGIDFENLIASLLAHMGFQIEMTKASGDGGVDIIATIEKPLLRGRYLIQCKRFAIGSPVGAPIVREFYGALRADHRAVKGIFVTTSSFTDQARDFARDLPIDLIDRGQLEHLLNEYKLLSH